MRWFQAACCVLILLGLVHSMSFLTAPPPPADDTEAKLQELMKTYKSDLMGVERTVQQLFTGFLISFSVLPLTMGVAGLVVARSGSRQTVRNLAAVYALGLAVMTGVSIGWWFHAPTSFLAVATLCYGIGWMKLD